MTSATQSSFHSKKMGAVTAGSRLWGGNVQGFFLQKIISESNKGTEQPYYRKRNSWIPVSLLWIHEVFIHLVRSDMMASSLKSKLSFVHPMVLSTQASSDRIINNVFNNLQHICVSFNSNFAECTFSK